MPLKEVFLSHQHEAAPEVAELATELRVRGIVPWVDKQQGGFRIGRESQPEARRVIREDCFGLLFYATEKAFGSDFIRDVEIDEAKLAREADPSYLLFDFARDIGFGELKRRSEAAFGIDLAAYHGVAIGTSDAPEEELRAKRVEVARLVLDEILARSVAAGRPSVSLQVSTRDRFPDDPGDALRIDATNLLRDRVDDRGAWARLLLGMCDVKDRLARAGARPRLYVHGSKHLTAAFMLGRVFAPFALDIRQTPDQIWRTDVSVPSGTNPLVATFDAGADTARQLFVGVASRNKDVAAGMEAFLGGRSALPPASLILVPPRGPLDVDNELCRAMVCQTYAEIEGAMRGRRFSSIHLFAAAPQAFMTMLGREFKGMPPVHLHEWDGARYLTSCTVPGGVL